MSIWGYFIHAGWVVKSVMFILLAGSITSWTLIIERINYFRTKKEATAAFLQRFWRVTDLNRLYAELDTNGEEKEGAMALFYEGFQVYWQRRQQGLFSIEPIERAMQIVYGREAVLLERHLPFFASLGSIAPYIGLFGTVWGIMTSLQALGHAQQATIGMVAPGISEALVATAIGLFAAIPAVIAYNRFTTFSGQILEQYELFQQELLALMEQQTDLAPPDRKNLRAKPAKPYIEELEV